MTDRTENWPETNKKCRKGKNLFSNICNNSHANN